MEKQTEKEENMVINSDRRERKIKKTRRKARRNMIDIDRDKIKKEVGSKTCRN